MSGPADSIVLATGNPHKVDELRAIIAQFRLNVRLLGLNEVRPVNGGEFVEPRESGTTFEQNAAIKACSYAEQAGRLCLADDSGLEIDALGGRPGVISSHYSTGGRETGLSRDERDAANNALVLEQLAAVPAEQRAARFVCEMALAAPPGWRASEATRGTKPLAPNDDLTHLTERLRSFDAEPGRGHVLLRSRGTFEGRIGVPPRVPSGKRGFGYDPLFLVAHPTGTPPRPWSQTASELDEESKNRLSHRGRAGNIMVDLLVRSGLAVTASGV